LNFIELHGVISVKAELFIQRDRLPELTNRNNARRNSNSL
jgi:hypothetical protein